MNIFDQYLDKIKNVLLETFTDLDITNTDAISTARKKIQMVDPTMVQTFDRLVNLERVAAVSEGDKSAFLLSIAKGDYDDDPKRMLLFFSMRYFSLCFRSFQCKFARVLQFLDQCGPSFNVFLSLNTLSPLKYFP